MQSEWCSDNQKQGETLSRASFRRLVMSLIEREQKTIKKKGLIGCDQTLAALTMGKSCAEIDAILINEDVLGFDSLGILNLIEALNLFFGLSTSGVEDYLLIKRRIGDWIDLLQHHRVAVGPDWSFGFQTSGSVGAPKSIVHRADELWCEMRAQSAKPFQDISAEGRIITLVPPHHIYGFLFACILPDLHKMAVIDLHATAPSAVFRHAKAGDLVVGTPFNWEMLHSSGKCFEKGVHGVTSAGPSKAKTWDVTDVCNLTKLTEIYGATETGGIGSRSAMDAPFQLLPHLQFSDGRIIRKAGQTALDVQDRLTWQDTETFRVIGRKDSAVQVAGVNVSPDLVRDELLNVDGIAQAAVRLGDSRLRAFIVPVPGTSIEELKERLRVHVAQALDAPARPVSFDFGPDLPRNAMGKLTDWATHVPQTA